MKRSLALAVFGLLMFSGTLGANHNTTHVFPQFADGRFPDGTFYRTTIIIENVLATATACTWTLTGMTTVLDTGEVGATFSHTFPAGASGSGLYIRTTTGTQGFQSGYATVTCDVAVFALVLYSFYSPNGIKLSEATVFSSAPNSEFLFPLDHRENARLGMALTNNTDSPHTYQLLFLPMGGGAAISATVTVAQRRTIAKFADELMTLPPNARGMLVLTSSDVSNFSTIGLRFTGAAFTTIPAFP